MGKGMENGELIIIKMRLIAILTLLCAALTAGAQTVPDTLLFVFKLHGQTRRFEMSFEERNDTIRLTWGIERKLKWLTGTYTMTPRNVENGSSLSFLQPENGNHVTLPPGETVYMIGRKALRTLKSTGRMDYNRTTYRLLDTDDRALNMPLLHVKDMAEGEEMWILDYPALPLVWRMKDNPLEINWKVMENG